jgi:hypothetical protein
MNTTTEPRGAGTGENAVAARSRDFSKKPAQSESGFKPGDETKYDEGDIDAGRIDPEQQADCITSGQIPMRDRRAYLLDQARRNEAANDELNAIQVDQNKRVQLAQSLLQDPDVQREESMVNAVASLKMHDPDTVKERQAQAQKDRDRKPKDEPKKDEPKK